MIPSYIIPPGVSPDEVAKKRAIADRLMMQGLQSQPQTIGDGLGAVADMLLGRGYYEASKKDSERMQEVGRQALGAWGMGGQPEVQATPPQQGMPSASVEPVQITNLPPPGYSDSVTVGGDGMGDIAPPAQMPQQQMAPAQPMAQVDTTAARRAFRNLSDDALLQNLMNPDVVKATEWLNPMIPKIAQEELARRWDYLSEQQKQEFQRNLKEREIAAGRETTAGEQGFDSFDEMRQGGGTWKSRQERRNFTDPGGVKFDEQVAAKIAENVPKYISVGENARAMNADLEVMRDIMTSIETGGLEGRAKAMFPTLDSAATFIDRRVNYWAPRMRVEGSGSTSDLEVGMMIDSWPSIKNDPTANALVIQMMMRKNDIDAKRGEIATLMASNQMDRREGMMRLMQLDQQSVMTPELDQMIRGVVDNSGMKSDQPQQGGGLSPEKMQRLEELRRKRDQGLIQ